MEGGKLMRPISERLHEKPARRKAGKKHERRTSDNRSMPNPQHKRDCERLLDDPIFGVKKK
jgi:hypothetical protein